MKQSQLKMGLTTMFANFIYRNAICLLKSVQKPFGAVLRVCEKSMLFRSCFSVFSCS